MSKPFGVLHITGTLEAGGLERMVVNLVNHLPQDRCRALLCTTRHDGPLVGQVASHVTRLQLRRRHRFDMSAVRKLVQFIRQQDIQILHAHGPSLFIAIVASLFSPFPAVIWHVHSGRMATGGGTIWPYKLVASRIKGVLAVNQALADWSCRTLHLPADKVWYVPNFVWRDTGGEKTENAIMQGQDLPGQKGYRIVCLANLRPLKDHPTLLQAMALVIQKLPEAHLALVGSTNDTAYLQAIQRLISQYRLEKHVSLLGHRDDVMGILGACDIGVLSSTSEGFPMTLLEYGMAGLPTVSTQVGQCPEVLNDGRAGLLVPPGSPTHLAEAIVELLQSTDRRKFLGKELHRHVNEQFSQHHVLGKFCQIYESMLEESK